MSRGELWISDALSLPLNAVTQTFAFMGKKGSGKTYAATSTAEKMLDEHAQVVALDPVGVWYGLRLAADGKSPGISIPVFGGLHGDIPLEPTGGKIIADLIVDRGISAVIDVSQFEHDTDKARFAGDFAARLFFRKKSSPSAIHVFLEECQEFVPQQPNKGEERMLHAFNRMVRLGRNFGIGVSLVSQRPQDVNKKALNQAECVFAFQLGGTHERKAVREWISEKDMDEDLVDELPKLKTGHAYVWSPSWLDISEKILFAKKRTFDSSATPEVGKRTAQRDLAPIELEQLRDDMAATIERAEADDPKVLRKRIAQLEAERGQKRETTAILTDEDRKAINEVSQLLAEASKLLRQQNERAIDVEAGRMTAYGRIESGVDELMQRLTVVVGRLAPETRKLVKILPKTPLASVRPEPRPAIRPPAMVAAPGSDAKKLGKGAREMLRSLKRMGPLTRAQLATLSGLSESGTFRNYLSDLRTAEYISEDGEKIAATESGEDAAGSVDASPITTDDLMGIWSARLGAGARRMLDVLVRTYPRSMPRSELARQTEMEESGTFRNYLSDLHSNGLVEKPNRSDVRAAEALFLGGRRR
jgi:hypothetical protein